MHQLQGIQDCFLALAKNGELVHTWTDLNVAEWDSEEVFQDPLQDDGYFDLFSRSLFYMMSEYYMC